MSCHKTISQALLVLGFSPDHSGYRYIISGLNMAFEDETLLLGITISFQMTAEKFVQWETLIIMGLGLFAFVFDTVGGVMCAKLMNLFSKEKINPMVGAAGISAFPMSARVIEKMCVKEDPSNHILMHAVGANVSGQIASATIGGLIIGLVQALL